MDIDLLNAKLDSLDYWDSEMLDFEIKYFGDEATLYIQQYDSQGRETDYCWKLTFFRCYRVNDETNAGRLATKNDGGVRKEIIARTYSNSQMTGRGRPPGSYYLYNMVVELYNDFLYKFDVTLSMMSIEIICQDFKLETVLVKKQGFFWDKTTKKTLKNTFRKFWDS